MYAVRLRCAGKIATPHAGICVTSGGVAGLTR